MESDIFFTNLVKRNRSIRAELKRKLNSIEAVTAHCPVKKKCIRIVTEEEKEIQNKLNRLKSDIDYLIDSVKIYFEKNFNNINIIKDKKTLLFNINNIKTLTMFFSENAVAIEIYSDFLKRKIDLKKGDDNLNIFFIPGFFKNETSSFEVFNDIIISKDYLFYHSTSLKKIESYLQYIQSDIFLEIKDFIKIENKKSKKLEFSVLDTINNVYLVDYIDKKIYVSSSHYVFKTKKLSVIISSFRNKCCRLKLNATKYRKREA